MGEATRMLPECWGHRGVSGFDVPAALGVVRSYEMN